MNLKQYQTETLCILRRFFEEARIGGPKAAYEAITNEPEQSQRLRGYGGTYTPLKELPNVPYICLRLPTGGGKTILGTYSIGIARDAWVEKDYPMVLWLVPSNTIRLQTAEALKDQRHPYRQALDEIFDGQVRVFDIADFTNLRPHDIQSHCCIVVGTIQTLRVTNTEGRKVYAHNENLDPHFSTMPQSLTGLEKLEAGGVKFSFANLLHIHRPLMIVDEAHNAVTGLSREMQKRVNPSAIIEFTATPQTKSNILHSVTAQELKREEMIKLPIMLSEHDTWQTAVSDAIAKRASLAKTAENDPEYIRPIVLFQAQDKNQEVTTDALKKHLIEVENISEEKIAIATGDQRELDGLDLFDPNCPIEYVITIKALKEGWDCSFAYVFCSVSRIGSTTDVEQLLGRVLRMPYAKRRQAISLNRAYASLSESSFAEAAKSLVDKLVSMGFEEDEAEGNITYVQGDLDHDTGIFEVSSELKETFRHTITASPEIIEEVEKHDRLSFREVEGGKVEVEVIGLLDKPLEELITSVTPEPEREELSEAISEYRAKEETPPSPAAKGEPFDVPGLVSEIQGELELADTDVFMEYHDWSLLDYSPKLTEDDFSIRETAREFEIDLDGDRITYQFSDEVKQLPLDVDVEGWTPEVLANWLDRQVRQPDILQVQMLRWLSDMVAHLTDERGISISALMRCKFILARKVRSMIADIRRQERDSVYQKYLFAPEAKVDVSFDHGFTFKKDMYQNEKCYRGSWKPKKHFLGPDRVPAFDGMVDGEEFKCAQTIDSLPETKYWIRNVSRGTGSFYLPTSDDNFYPDFVVHLEDGRTLVVEYKGAHLVDSKDTREKRTIGDLWERTSKGKGLFIIVEKEVDGKGMREQLEDKVGA